MNRAVVARRIRSLVWDVRRFGLAPSAWQARLRPGNGPRVLCNSLPKAGTHLLERALCLSPGLYRKLVPTLTGATLTRRGGLSKVLAQQRGGQVLVGHLEHTPDRKRALDASATTCLFMVRNPRDLAVSQVHYIMGESAHKFHDALAAVPDFQNRLRLIVDGSPAHGLISIGQRLRLFETWLDDAAMVIRFEDLVGARGGGNDETQHATISKMFACIGAPIDDARVARIGADLFSAASPTFRRGAVGEGAQSFDDDLERALERSAGATLERYGYR